MAGRSGGSHEAVENGVTGLVVDNPLSARDLAQAIGEILADPARRAAFGEASRAAAVDAFDWNRLARRLGDGLAPYDHQRTASTPA